MATKEGSIPRATPSPMTASETATRPYPVPAPARERITIPAAQSRNPAAITTRVGTRAASRSVATAPTMTAPIRGRSRMPVPWASVPSTSCR